MEPKMTHCKGPTSRLRVAVLTTTYPRDEADPCPPFVFELCRRLAVQLDVTVLAPACEGAREGLWEGVTVVRYRYAPRRWQTLAAGGGILPNLRRSPWMLVWLPGLLLGQAFALWSRRRQYDVIHAHWIIPQGLIGICFGAGQPVLSTSHGADIFALRGRLWDGLRGFVVKRAAALTAVGAPIESSLRRLASGTPVHRLPMGVDIRARFTPDESVSPASGRILYVGRLVPKKGVDLLLQAMKWLISKRPGLSLQIIGEGPERAGLCAHADVLGLTRSVEFVGAVTNRDLPRYYQAAAVVALPFRIAADGDEEGLGLTLIEALACGCPVVVGRVSAQDEITQSCEGLWRCNPADAAEFGSCLGTALDMDTSRAHLRATRQPLLEEYDWERVADAHLELLRAVAARI